MKAGKYLEWRQCEGSAVVPRCAGFPLSFARVRRTGVALFAVFLSEHHHKSQEVKRFEQTVVILPIDNDVIIRRQKLLADTREGLLVQLLTSLTQQIDLKEVLGQILKDTLINDRKKV